MSSTKAERKVALEALNETLNRSLSTGLDDGPKILSSVASQLGGDNHPYKFSRTDPEFVILLNSSAAAIATEACTLGVRCWDDNNRQIVKEEVAARVFAVHKETFSHEDWFEPTVWGNNSSEYWKPKVIAFINSMLVVATMVVINYLHAYYSRIWNCHWPTVYNLGGILDTPFCSALKWVDTLWSGIQKSFVFGGAAAIAYRIPTMFGWRAAPNQSYI